MHKIFKTLTLISLLALLVGCQLAVSKEDIDEKLGELETIGIDRLVGFLITTDHAPIENYMRGEDRIVGEPLYDEEMMDSYDFNGAKGILYTQVLIDDIKYTFFGEGVSNSQSHVEIDEDKNTEVHTLNAQIYVYNNDNQFYKINPIYQKENGEVYLTVGTAYAIDLSEDRMEGSLLTIEMSEDYKTLDDKTISSSFSIEFVHEYPVTEMTVIEMDAKNNLIKSQTVSTEAETLELSDQAEYIIVEFLKGEEEKQKIVRKIFDRNDTSIHLFVDEKEPILSGKLIALDWK